jgi:RimK family alpha-L-glutamate ligase
MKKIRFIIFASRIGSNWRDLAIEIKARGFECAVLDFADTTFDFCGKDLIAKNGEINLGDADIFLLQSFAGYVREAKIFMERMVFEGKVVVDEGICRRIAEGKLLQASKLQRAGLDIPRTYQANTFNAWKGIIRGLDMPIVVKPVKSSRGQGIIKIDTKRKALEFFKENPCDYLAQEFFKLDSDLRILVVKNEVLGGIRRFVVPGDFRTNCSLGSRAEKIVITKEIRTIALRAAKAVGYEVAGVDLFEYGGKLYVLEVNPSPQWKIFKETTGVNPAGAVVDLALEKYNKRKHSDA